LSSHTKGKTIIVMSTLAPDLMGELGKKVEAESDLKLISAAVSGGASGAQAGTLSIMTSGAEDIVKSFRPNFDAARQLGSVWIQREFMTAAAILIMAAKL
jgi:3-hydroxyisobutyrate dehydrogenase-like beta-hydroxyacid dehydrogenase